MKRLLVLLAVAAACHEPSDAGPASFEPVLSTRELWSGGELTLTEPWFSQAAPVVVLGTDTLTPTRLNDTTFVLRLPRRSGSFSLKVLAYPASAELGSVTLHGFQDVVQGPFMSGQPYWLRGAGAPLVFAGANAGAAIVDLSTRAPVYSVPDSIHSSDCTWTPSPSNVSDRFVMIGKRADGSCTRPRLWRLTAPPTLVDTLFCCGDTWYTSGQPSPGRWIFNWNNHNQFYICDTSCMPTFFNSPDGPNGVTISPRGDRFLWLPADRPIIRDAQTLDTAYVVPGFEGLQSAFSADGDTLALTAYGDGAPSSRHVLLLRAGDGTVLRDMLLDSLHTGHTSFSNLQTGPLAFDPVQPWLYVTMLIFSQTDTAWKSSIVVVDRANWSVLGVLDMTSRNSHLTPCLPMTVVPSPLEHRVYVVNTHTGYRVHNTAGIIVRYTTP